MRIAFYAPMKAPDYPTRSGDRLLARLFIKALEAAGHEVVLASRLRSRVGDGERRRQERIRVLGARMASRLVRRYGDAGAWRPDLWFTYHLYHKAPDWLGPPVAKALGIPYVIAEASFAPKRSDGPWAEGHAAAREAIAAAAAVINLNPVDAACVRPLLSAPERLVSLAPFVDAGEYPVRGADGGVREHIAERYGLSTDEPWMIAVAMMRPGNKRDSYRLLADALAMLEARPWQLLVVGDGSVREEVASFFARFDRRRVTFTGALDAAELHCLLCGCDLFVWPGVREPIGMAMLEAQMVGLPVVTGDGPGIAGIVRDGCTGRLVPRGDVGRFADAVGELLDDAAARTALGARARCLARRHHDIGAASETLDAVLRGLRAGTWP